MRGPLTKYVYSITKSDLSKTSQEYSSKAATPKATKSLPCYSSSSLPLFDEPSQLLPTSGHRSSAAFILLIPFSPPIPSTHYTKSSLQHLAPAAPHHIAPSHPINLYPISQELYQPPIVLPQTISRKRSVADGELQPVAGPARQPHEHLDTADPRPMRDRKKDSYLLDLLEGVLD